MTSATAAPSAAATLRIGQVADRAGTTPRTVRYYEEIGLLPGSAARAHGKHRLYTDADVERLQQILRLKELLGVSLEELGQLVEAEDARAALRERWHEDDDPEARRRILAESLGHIDRQLALVRARHRELERLEADLVARRRRNRDLRRQLG